MWMIQNIIAYLENMEHQQKHDGMVDGSELVISKKAHISSLDSLYCYDTPLTIFRRILGDCVRALLRHQIDENIKYFNSSSHALVPLRHDWPRKIFF